MKYLFVLFFVCQFAQGQIVDRFIRFVASPLYDFNNAATPAPNEVNGVVGWTVGVLTSVSSTSTDPFEGSFRIEMLHTGGTDEFSSLFAELNLENGATYQIDVHTQELVSTNFQVSLRTDAGWTVADTKNTPSGGWQLITVTATTNTTTPRLRFSTTASGDGGDKLGIDNIVITKL